MVPDDVHIYPTQGGLLEEGLKSWIFNIIFLKVNYDFPKGCGEPGFK